MITGLIVIGLFFITSYLALIERHIGKSKLPLYMVLGFFMIFVAGLREIGIDPDSESYEYSYIHYASSTDLEKSVEFSYLWIASILNNITPDAHAILLFYAFLGLSIKFIAFRHLTDFWFLPLVLYISTYYVSHEMMQIRTGVLSALFLLGIHYQVQGRRLLTFLCLSIGAFFHYSALILFPLMFLSTDYMTKKVRLIWASFIPIAYILYFRGIGVFMTIDIPYIGDKLAAYQMATEKETLNAYVNVFRPLHLFSITLFLYLLYYYDLIVKRNRHFTLLLKIFIIGLSSYEILGFLPILAQRINQLLVIVIIPLYSYIYYTIRPFGAAILIVIFVAFVYLNYTLPLISTYLLWNG